MNKEQEMKQARQWLYENADAVAQWAVQITKELTVSGAFYFKEQLYTALTDTLPLLTPQRTGRDDLTPLPQSEVARRMIVANTASAVMEHSVSREFETQKGVEIRYTTDELLEAEQAIFKNAVAMQAKPADNQPFADVNDIHRMSDHLADIVINGAKLDMPKEYMKAFDDFLKPGNLRIANGPPGSGKSTLAQGLLFALTKDAMERGGQPPAFYATAPSHKAAADIVGDMNVMKSFCEMGGAEDVAAVLPEVKGAPSLDDMIKDLQAGKISAGSVLVVDEAGLMGAKQMASLLQAANEQDIRLFMMGDNLQIPPKTAGNGFDQLLQNKDELGLETCELRVVLRQKTKGESDWTIDLREGKTLQALQGYANRRYTGYAVTANGQLAVSYTDTGDKGDPGLQMQKDTEAVYTQLTQDFIEYRRNCPDGSYVVMGTDEKSASDLNLFMRREMIAAKLISNVKNYGTEDCPFEIGNGDTLMLDRPITAKQSGTDNSSELQAGSQLLVVGEKDGILTVRQGDKTFDCEPEQLVENAKYGLALPLYQAQGQSKDRAFLAVDKAGCMDKVYGGVAFSRHMRQMSAYVSEQAYPTLGDLANEMSVFRTRQPLISDGKGCEILRAAPQKTEENVAKTLRALQSQMSR